MRSRARDIATRMLYSMASLMRRNTRSRNVMPVENIRRKP